MATSILYLVGAYPRWSETFIRQDLTLLQRLGVPLLPVSLFPGDTATAPEWPSVTVLGHPSGLPAPRSSPRSGFGHGLSLWLPRRLRPWFSLVRHRRLRRQLRDLAVAAGVSHVHAEFADLPALMAVDLGRQLGTRYSVGTHARDVYTAKYDLARLLASAAFVTVCNAAARDRLLADGPAPAERLHLIPHGLILDEWPFSESSERPHDPMRLLFAGRLVAKKGLSDLLRAQALAAAAGRNVRLTVAGGGPEEPVLRRLASDLGLRGCVEWRGVVTRSEVRTLLRETDALVAPGVTAPDGDRDGIPNVVLEALALGTPVLATSAGGLAEAITEQTGWVFRARAPEHLVAQLLEFRDQREAAGEKSRNGRRLVETEFDAAKLARQRAALFEAVLPVRA